MNHAYFLTGTDTEVGKTHIACALLERARQEGLHATGLKPVAAGIEADGENDDVRRIRQASNVALPDRLRNPYCFAPPIAPHLAAAQARISIDFARIADTVQAARQAADFVVVEGAGGFCIPLGPDKTSADLAVALRLPLILVVGLRLGCLNHALLTTEAIVRRGLRLAGWVGNHLATPMAFAAENMATLRASLAAPCLGEVRWQPQGNARLSAAELRLPEEETLRSFPDRA
ncbi:MAG: dethiobiotin synthase [Azonexus sp.]